MFQFSSPSQNPKPLVSSTGVSHEANKIANKKIYFFILIIFCYIHKYMETNQKILSILTIWLYIWTNN